MKGGSGKSTLASCLAVHWHLCGRHPTLIDADPQRSIVRLAARERALGGVAVVEDATEEAPETARTLASGGGLVIIDTPGFRSLTTLDCIAAADFLLVPVKPSPFDVDRMLDTLSHPDRARRGRQPLFRCVLTQTTRDSVIAKQIRAELSEAGLPVLQNEMTNRVAYPEAAPVGRDAQPDQWKGPAREEIAAIAEEVDMVSGDKRQLREASTRKISPRPSGDGGELAELPPASSRRSLRLPAIKASLRDLRGRPPLRQSPRSRCACGTASGQGGAVVRAVTIVQADIETVRSWQPGLFRCRSSISRRWRRASCEMVSRWRRALRRAVFRAMSGRRSIASGLPGRGPASSWCRHSDELRSRAFLELEAAISCA